jgi:hypothetical protein
VFTNAPAASAKSESHTSELQCARPNQSTHNENQQTNLSLYEIPSTQSLTLAGKMGNEILIFSTTLAARFEHYFHTNNDKKASSPADHLEPQAHSSPD